MQGIFLGIQVLRHIAQLGQAVCRDHPEKQQVYISEQIFH
jgi:hypothetical protein